MISGGSSNKAFRSLHADHRNLALQIRRIARFTAWIFVSPCFADSLHCPLHSLHLSNPGPQEKGEAYTVCERRSGLRRGVGVRDCGEELAFCEWGHVGWGMAANGEGSRGWRVRGGLCWLSCCCCSGSSHEWGSRPVVSNTQWWPDSADGVHSPAITVITAVTD